MTQYDRTIRQKENAMMKTLLFATAVVTVLAAAAPAVARGPHGYYSDYGLSYAFGPRHRVRIPRGDYGYYYAPYNPSAAYGFHGYVPDNYATYCGQLPKAC
jgi:hypothetical protein